MAGITLNADSEGLVSAMESSREAISSVATAAEAARSRMVTSWRTQIAAAEEAGASQAQLARITSKYESFIANTTEESVRRQINAMERYEAAIAKRRAAASTLVIPAAPFAPDTSPVPTAPTAPNFTFGGLLAKESEEARELATAVEGVSEAHSRGVAPAVQFGAVIRSMEGGFSRNVRAAEVFGSSISALQPLIAMAFPVVGVVTLGYALVQMGEHAYKAWENIVMLREATQALNKEQINVDKIVNENHDATEHSVESILEVTQGKSAALRQRYSYQQNRPLENDKYFYSDSFSKLPNDVKANYETQYKSIEPQDIATRRASIAKEVRDLQSAYNDAKNPANFGMVTPRVNGFGPNKDRDPASYYADRLKAAQQIQQLLDSGSESRTAKLQAIQTETSKALQDEAKKSSDALTAAQKKAAEAQMKQWEDDNSNWKAVQDRSLLEDAGWWRARLDTLNKGSINYLAVDKKINEDHIAENRQTAETIAKYTQEYRDDFEKTNGLPSLDISKISDSGKAAADYVTALRARIDLTRQNSDAVAEYSIQMALATGQMSKFGAAQALAALHSQQFEQRLTDLGDERDAVASNGGLTDLQRQARNAQIDNQERQIRNDRARQVDQDRQAINPAASLGTVGFTDALNDFVTATRDAAAQLREITSSTLNSVNGEIVKAISGQRTNWGNAGAGIFRNVAGVGLQKAEGSILGGLGFGGKADGSRSNPLYVRMADSVGSAASHLASSIGGKSGGLLGGLINLLPHFAAGGPISANTLSVVGENGPELFNPGMSGSIIPNHALSSIGGSGGDTHYWNIDARGSTDPAQTAAQVQRGIQYAAPHIVAASQRASSEKAKRTPSSKR